MLPAEIGMTGADTTSSDGIFLIGCAGWSIAAACAADFPTAGTHLERYARVFDATEINSSFYRPHRPQTYARWSDSVPDHFRFSVKMPRRITHELRLRDCESEIDAFLAGANMLGPKLGCLLVQLPPSLAFDAQAASGFFSALRCRYHGALACEPRHESWFTDAAAELLKETDGALVRADPRIAPPGFEVAGKSTVYVRLHGSPDIYRSAYGRLALEQLAGQIAGDSISGRKVWCIFDNTANGAAIPDALMLRGILRRTGAPA